MKKTTFDSEIVILFRLA